MWCCISDKVNQEKLILNELIRVKFTMVMVLLKVSYLYLKTNIARERAKRKISKA